MVVSAVRRECKEPEDKQASARTDICLLSEISNLLLNAGDYLLWRILPRLRGPFLENAVFGMVNIRQREDDGSYRVLWARTCLMRLRCAAHS